MHISQVSQHTNEQERARKASQPPRFCVKRLKPLLSRHMQWASIWTDRSPLALGWRLVSFLNMVASSFTIEEIRTAMQTAQHRGIFYHMWRLPTGNANNTFQKPPSSHWISGQNRPRYLDLRHRTIATLCGCNQNHLDSTGTPGSFLNRVVILLLFLFRNALFCFSKEEYHLLHYGCLWACAGQPFRRLESRSNVFYVLSTFPQWRRRRRSPLKVRHGGAASNVRLTADQRHASDVTTDVTPKRVMRARSGGAGGHTSRERTIRMTRLMPSKAVVQ